MHCLSIFVQYVALCVREFVPRNSCVSSMNANVYVAPLPRFAYCWEWVCLGIGKYLAHSARKHHILPKDLLPPLKYGRALFTCLIWTSDKHQELLLAKEEPKIQRRGRQNGGLNLWNKKGGEIRIKREGENRRAIKSHCLVKELWRSPAEEFHCVCRN